MVWSRRCCTLVWMIIIAFLFIYYNIADLPFQHGSKKNKSKLAVNEFKLISTTAHDRMSNSLDTISQQTDHKLTYKNVSIHHIAQQPFQKVQFKRSKWFSPTKSSFSKRELKMSNTDVQMVSLYQKLKFDDNSSEVWQQNITYSASQWSQKQKLKVFIVPYSHFDLGWLVKPNCCYMFKINAIFKNILEQLSKGPDRKFIWTETNYLHLWWHDPNTTSEQKRKLKYLLISGNLEIVTGGWVMNDEANSHWISIVQQLTTGHQWLLKHIKYIPKNSWQIEAFGHSSTQAYLNKLAGFDNHLIQRAHYRVKKELALNRQLEFKWRQLWDVGGKTDMFTHLTPFSDYNVAPSCGPEPKICCQFDFKRLLTNSTNNSSANSSSMCPERVAPTKITPETWANSSSMCPGGVTKITPKNLYERASLILDQWRKKAQLYRSNVVMYPLGDDGQYVGADEWDAQYQNYELLRDYITHKPEFNAEVQFGTLQDYFKAVHAEVQLSNFPVLSGDFFTYADRGQHYWSGYYTSRPFYKNMDRVLLAYVRAAESLTALAVTSQAITRVTSQQMCDSVETARRALALFQHHDGITGTARDEVRVDYANKLLSAIKTTQSVVQRAAYILLKKPALSKPQANVYFKVDDIWRRYYQNPSRITITQRKRRLVLYNALAFTRQEVFTVYVSSPLVLVHDSEGKVVAAQVSPVVPGPRTVRFAVTKYQLSFLVTVKPLSLAVYTVFLHAANANTSYARVRVINIKGNIELPKMFNVEKLTLKRNSEITLQAGKATKVVATRNGLIRALISQDGTTTPVHMEFVKYVNSSSSSDAYVFIPTKPAVGFRPLFSGAVVVEGLYHSTLYSILSEPKKARVMMAISVYDNPSLPQTEVEITNTLLLSAQADDLELAMRLSTPVRNKDVFYTDLNGMGMIKRRHFKKLPLQANYYPMSGAMYIEDKSTRVTLLTFTPLGVATLKPGSIEVMQDRYLNGNKQRQGVQDNIRTRHTFRLLVERADKRCESVPLVSRPYGLLSLGAHVSQQLLLQPLIRMQYSPPSNYSSPHYSSSLTSAADIVLASFRAHVTAKDDDDNIFHGMGMTFQRVRFNSCYGNKKIGKWYPVGNGKVRITEIVEGSSKQILESSLTHVRLRGLLAGDTLTLHPMDVRSVFVVDDR